VSKFAQQESIKLSTLYSWQKQFKTSGFSVTKAITPDNWSAEEKFATVLETVTLSEIEVSEYCRIKGLYPDQIKTWKLACIEGNLPALKGSNRHSYHVTCLIFTGV
jgi:transposase-like protein